MSDVLKRIPNWLTSARLFLIPVFVICMVDPSRSMVWVATVVFIIAAITDYADGYLARRFKAVTDFGKLLDPMADKILVMSALVMLVAQRSDVNGAPWVPGWMVVVILAREIWITGLRAVAASRGQIIAARSAGKYKSALQMVAIVLLLFHEIPFVGTGYSCQFAGACLLFISMIFSIWGAMEYTQEILFYPQAASPAAPAEPTEGN